MRKRDLEIRLQSVRNFEDPDPSLEQYMTPATIAADILYTAYGNGDIEGLKVVDLGCGTGMFSIGAWMLGAGMVVGYDVSESALRVARSNAECQNRNADRAFLDKAMECSECVYSIHMAETLEFVEGFCRDRGRTVTWRKTYKYEIPHTFSFHKKAKMSVDVAVVNIR